jgi:HEXXH motif-containing protein
MGLMAGVYASDVVHDANGARLLGACRQALLEEWSVLDEYLGGQLSSWRSLSKAWGLQSLAEAPGWKSLALPLLASHRAVCALQAQGVEAAEERCRTWKLAPLRMQELTLSGWKRFKIVSSHPLFDEEAASMHHPAMPGATALCGDVDVEKMAESLRDALELVGRGSERSTGAVSAGMAYFVMLRKPEAMGPEECISFTSRSAPGAVFLTPMPPILLAESIVHECVHGVLYGASRLSKLTTDDAGLFASPLRPDLRPVSGILHQALVLDYLVDFYEGLAGCRDVPSVARNQGPIAKRLDKHRVDREKALGVLQSEGQSLESFGADLVREMGARPS